MDYFRNLHWNCTPMFIWNSILIQRNASFDSKLNDWKLIRLTKSNLVLLSMAWEQWRLTGHGPVNALRLLGLTIMYSWKHYAGMLRTEWYCSIRYLALYLILHRDCHYSYGGMLICLLIRTQQYLNMFKLLLRQPDALIIKNQLHDWTKHCTIEQSNEQLNNIRDIKYRFIY